MKRILAIAILVASFCVSAVSARAESNPLLTVFEGIQQGKTLLIDAKSAILGFRAFDENILWLRTDDGHPDVYILVWEWTENHYSRSSTSGAHINRPRAILKLVMRKPMTDEDDKLLVHRAVYEYKFLHTTKELVK